ncbi:MAG: hypothetical protein ABI851_14075 [Saprospiraceae bacterium]
MRPTKIIDQSIFILKILSLLLVILLPQNLKATHIVGGDLEYRCLGNNLYEITLTLRRDCINGQATFDNPAHLGIFNSAGVLLTNLATRGILNMAYNPDDTLNEFLVKTCGIVGGDVCVHTTLYRDTVELPFLKNGYILAYQRCCRNFTIQNIVNPLQSGATYTLEIKEEALLTCNSSPRLGKYPPIYICGGHDIEFNLRAIDDEGDSLVYKMCTPYLGADQMVPLPNPPSNPPYAEVVFDPPYSLQDMIGGVPPLNIGSSNGIMKGYAVSNIAQYLIAYCIEEYRHGKLLSIIRRDFQINVRLCNSAPIADFTTEIKSCKMPIVLNCTDQSSDAYSVIKKWDWTIDAGTNQFHSNLKNPVFNINYEGVVKIQLIAESEIQCKDTITKEILFRIIKPELKNLIDTICQRDSIELKGVFPGIYNYEWFPSTGLSCSKCPNPKAGPDISTVYVLRSFNGDCQRLDTVQIVVKPCIVDPCDIQIEEKCLANGMIQLSVLNTAGQLIIPKIREQELFWDIAENVNHPKYIIQNQNPILLFNKDKYSLTSKYYSWPAKVPKSIEYAKICTRRISNVLALECKGPCEKLEFILSSCEDDYDINNNLNFPTALCKSICSNQCNFIVALFEKNGQLINPSEYEIKWSTGGNGAYVDMMQPYYNTLSVEVKKGDCIWRGRYWKKCDDYNNNIELPDLKLRSKESNIITKDEFELLMGSEKNIKLFNVSGQLINPVTSHYSDLAQGLYFITIQENDKLKIIKYFKH